MSIDAEIIAYILIMNVACVLIGFSIGGVIR